MAWSAGGASQDAARRGLDIDPRPQQDDGIEVALDTPPGHAVPAVGEVDPPVEPDDVPTGPGQGRQQPARPMLGQPAATAFRTLQARSVTHLLGWPCTSISRTILPS